MTEVKQEGVNVCLVCHTSRVCPPPNSELNSPTQDPYCYLSSLTLNNSLQLLGQILASLVCLFNSHKPPATIPIPYTLCSTKVWRMSRRKRNEQILLSDLKEAI